jgi:hypothetical protein
MPRHAHGAHRSISYHLGGGPPASAIESTTRRTLTFRANGVLSVNWVSRRVFRTIRPGGRV